MQNKKIEKLVLDTIFIVFAIILIYFFGKNLIKDYFFVFTKIKTQAEVIVTGESNKDNITQIKYYNKYLEKNILCNLKRDYNGKLQNEEALQIYYTKYRSSDIYIIKDGYPGLIIILIRLVFFVAFCVFLISKLADVLDVAVNNE